ncbi:radical SAM protein [Vibrio vulnificus]|nr:radical SAM protein [Vibrio vulnificus]
MENIDSLQLIILPTEKCNFRCTYCYENFVLGRMNQETLSNVKSLISNLSNEVKKFSIGWFGGEPLLAKKEVLDICLHSQEVAQKQNLEFKSSMTTNGFLLDSETLVSLVAVGVDTFQITLDGPEELHNTTRVKVNGGDTYSTILNNLITARDSDLDFTCTLRLHYNLENYGAIKAWLQTINREFGNDKRFKLMPKDIGRYGGQNDSKITPVSFQDKLRIEDELSKVLNKANVVSFDDAYVCYAAKLNSFVIRSDGRIAKCTVALNSTYNDIGHLTDIGMSIDSEKLFDWVQGSFSGDRRELSCPNSILKDNQYKSDIDIVNLS